MRLGCDVPVGECGPALQHAGLYSGTMMQAGLGVCSVASVNDYGQMIAIPGVAIVYII